MHKSRYICLACKNSLRLDQTGNHFVCPDCSAEYPVVNQLPRFVPMQNYADSFGYQWNRHRKTQLDSYSGLPVSRNRLFSVTGWQESLQGQKILEAGSGAGRFTEILLSTGADVVSFDYSNAVEANFANNGESTNLQLFQADIYNIPLPKHSFDKVICLGVLQHTPDPQKAFMSLAQFVKPAGELVIDIYRSDILGLIQWKYLLRPLTTKLKNNTLYNIIAVITPKLIPAAALLRKIAGRAGARLIPIVEYTHLGLSADINRDWAILDTFDMYSPLHDHPQSISTVKNWFESAGFEEINVKRGQNGITGKGKKPLKCAE